MDDLRSFEEIVGEIEDVLFLLEFEIGCHDTAEFDAHTALLEDLYAELEAAQ